ncbi:MAG: hypothetical protein PVS3B3_22320 [Ktedonobacteraceae bacterium]
MNIVGVSFSTPIGNTQCLPMKRNVSTSPEIVYRQQGVLDETSISGEYIMEKKKRTFSTMEIVLLGTLVGSLILSFIQARQDEKK